MTPGAPLTAEEKEDLGGLSDLAAGRGLCSRLFPHFLRRFEADTGREPSGAARRIAGLIEEIDRMGMHCSPSVVARVLAEYAGLNRR